MLRYSEAEKMEDRAYRL